MKFALINPHWSFKGSIYFGCREPHLPIEYGYAKTLLEKKKHEVLIIDCHRENLSVMELRNKVITFNPDYIVITTAPTYLYWRCTPPELTAPIETIEAIKDLDCIKVIVGPHGSVTPVTTLRKLGADIVIIGECEEIIPLLNDKNRNKWKDIHSICYKDRDQIFVTGGPHASNMSLLPPIIWSKATLDQYRHQHHRFDSNESSSGAELEGSRGCPYNCLFCAKDNFRNRYRKRPLTIVLKELDNLINNGIEYIYFIDEIFLPDKELLSALIERNIKFGMQTRIDLWNRQTIDLLNRAGCISMEAGIESISEKGQLMINKQYIISTEQATEYLIYAKKRIPFVQATLIDSRLDSQEAIENWRQYLQHFGVWANKPYPLFPYPGSAEYAKMWGDPDMQAWERAQEYYHNTYTEFNDLQEEHFLHLSEREVRSIHEQRMRITN
ncbi:MAG: TIGR04295 family B12-binding domain-containing radical SAM protein [Candidatus Margulisiibacteriota bacterium]|nr:MAG: B12-binding domain/radical SAM domain-containing protein [Candidatus Margulisbacteria bacterium GWD2_39_127]OGI04356.1 MAG: B12-binding domain/radical SAM domain-containing protein [Candidatus Margulisbacteria bacterium GWF2_38_17]OGI07788.1 MAG: B12-binding domain/radical SAM domain-containing protein [Candidatus Margulisbacteria bacterium GWE2_39_32]PZM84837.1 MAG: TIGR04295 family B12-binding domain-containing radical SAM protein [Candidatus Margulisiibacteriota bacterium]HAR63290.1 